MPKSFPRIPRLEPSSIWPVSVVPSASDSHAIDYDRLVFRLRWASFDDRTIDRTVFELWLGAL